MPDIALLKMPQLSVPHTDIGEGMEKPKNVQKPQNHGNDHNGIQDRLNGARHWYIAIDEPEKNSNHN
jgi:hypothetical protein